MRLITDAEALQRELDSLSLVGRISAVKVARMGGDDFERQFVDGISDPFKYIRIDCERHSLYLSYLTYAVMNNVERLDSLDMTMGELKEAVSYYSDLFDQA